MSRCPYPDCRFDGTDAEVDDHRTAAHRDEPQAGGSLAPDVTPYSQRRKVYRIRDSKFGRLVGPEYDTEAEARTARRAYSNPRRYDIDRYAAADD
ncbi:hypothetical protein [Jiangella muralis]|uniref:hypothetical protein n=1 Tax=Jiangella muralis TaxID=702383 RepID=UPI00069D0199|nr:hypothetical protein [Jiangella muralis]